MDRTYLASVEAGRRAARLLNTDRLRRYARSNPAIGIVELLVDPGFEARTRAFLGYLDEPVVHREAPGARYLKRREIGGVKRREY